MAINRVASALVAGALGLGVAGFGTSAFAADIPVKAKAPPSSPWVLDVHGSVDITVANTRVTGGGLFLYPTNSTILQQSIGVQLDIYKNASSFINSFSVFGGVWNEVYTDPHAFQSNFRHWQEMDWWLGFKVGFASYWTFSYQHLEFAFPGPTINGPDLPTAVNDVFAISFNDSFLGLPITFNPYFQIFYNERGGSTVVFGKKSDAYRLEAGIVPTYSFMKSAGIPLTITAPTWIEFGPSEFWNNGSANCNGNPCSLNNVGYVSTGLHGKYTLEAIVPKRLGTWYVKGGFQFYHITNDALLGAQVVVGSVGAYKDAKKDITVVNGGMGFSF